jgi:hypothetical protein
MLRCMRWPFSRRPFVQEPSPHSSPSRAAHPVAGDAADLPAFVCSTCGRTDLPPAGDWDPPVCLECDAAINFDAECLEADWDE